jgi:hypothetical protein
MQPKQSEFVRMVGLLIMFATQRGYELTFGDACASAGGHRDNSFHYKRLAIDLNLFRDGKYLGDTKDHAELGAFWKSIGGTWGGDFKNLSDDGNHYSYGERV